MTGKSVPSSLDIAAAIIVNGNRVLMVRRKAKEGELSWQFPAGGVEPGETAEQAAERETVEETGLTVTARQLLGSRIHPKTNRQMHYTACDVVSGAAHVADADELAEIAWVAHNELPEYVPYGLFGPVQTYLDSALTNGPGR